LHLRIPTKGLISLSHFGDEKSQKYVEKSHLFEKGDDPSRKMREKRDLAPKNSELALEKTILALNLKKLARKCVI